MMANRLVHRSGGGGRHLKLMSHGGIGCTIDDKRHGKSRDIAEWRHWSIVADTRLDNHFQLCNILKLEPTQTSTGLLLLRAFERWQQKCVDHLLGDFAFAIWDDKEKQLFCTKDHAGVKPFLYFYSQEWFVFASELRAIVDLPFLPKKLNRNKLRAHLLNLGAHYSADTFFCNIWRLMPGRSLKLQKDNLNISRYWRPEEVSPLRLADDRAYAEAFRSLLEKAVYDRLTSNAPVGLKLSGGLDSSTIACIAGRQLSKTEQPLYTVSAVLPENFDGIEEDERSYINLLSKTEKNLKLAFLSARNDSAFSGLSDIFKQTYSPVSYFYYLDVVLFRYLREKWGVKRALSGYGGDGTVSFNGSNALPDLFRRGNFATWYRILQNLHRIEGKGFWKIIKNKTILPLIPPKVLELWLEIYRKRQPLPLLLNVPAGIEFAAEIDYRSAIREDSLRVYHPFNIKYTLWNEYTNWFPEEDLPLETQFGLEMLYPFMDRRIIEFLMAIPSEQFLQGGWKRGLIRAATAGILPEEIRWRRDKTLFSPDYTRRIVQERKILVQSLRQASKDPLISHFLNISAIISVLESATIPKDWSEFDNRMISVVGKGIIALSYLRFWQNSPKFDV